MAVPGIGAVPGVVPAAVPSQSTGSGAAAGGAGSFADMISGGIESVSAAEVNADQLAERLATGDPTVQLHDVTIAAAEATLSLQLMVAVRDRALDAYTQIMNLQL